MSSRINLEWIFWRLAHEESFKYFDSLKHPFRIQAISFLEEHLKKGYSVMDLGCARGELTFLISQYVNNVIGIDYNPSHIETAKKEYNSDNIEYLEGEALEYLEQNSNKFDVLILSHILEHLERPSEFLKQFKGFFKYIYIEVPDFEKNYLNAYRGKLKLNLIYTDSDHISEFDRMDISTLLRDNNLKCLSKEFKSGIQRYWCQVT